MSTAESPITKKTPQELAQSLFDELDPYGINCITAYSTAYTDYEDHGEEVCRILEQLCRAWTKANYDEKNQRIKFDKPS